MHFCFWYAFYFDKKNLNCPKLNSTEFYHIYFLQNAQNRYMEMI